jgi:hypothetical protein
VTKREPLTPSQRRQQARVAAFKMHAAHDPKETTAKARATFLSKFEEQVDPERKLSEAERQRRAEAARKAHFTELSLKSSIARQKRKKG